MSGFKYPVILEALPDGIRWQTKGPVVYQMEDGEIINVPFNFVTDLASIPRIFWSILPPFGKYDGAAIVHDYLYTVKTRTRLASDNILLEAMKSEGVSFITRWTIYLGVRIGGWTNW